MGPAPPLGPDTGKKSGQSNPVDVSTAPPPGAHTGRNRVPRNARKMSTAPVLGPILTPRALQELLKRNHNNYVSIKEGDVELLRVHRPVAMRFSSAWNRELRNPMCTRVTVKFPPEPPAAPIPSGAPLASQSEAIQCDVPTSPEPVPPPPPPPSSKTALKFIVQWMEAGGADPKGINAVGYPKGYRPALEKLLAVAAMLEVKELVTRLDRDLKGMRLPKPKKCPTCKKFEHPGKECQACFHCGDHGHRVRECPVRHQAFLEREARRARKAEYARQREITHQRWLEKEERRRKGEEKRGIAAGELGVNDAGKTIPVKGPGRLTFGRTLSSP